MKFQVYSKIIALLYAFIKTLNWHKFNMEGQIAVKPN
jgi:hypothetical protein